MKKTLKNAPELTIKSLNVAPAAAGEQQQQVPTEQTEAKYFFRYDPRKYDPRTRNQYLESQALQRQASSDELRQQTFRNGASKFSMHSVDKLQAYSGRYTINQYVPHTVVSKNHPILKMGEDKHYFISTQPEYKNYKYLRQKLRNTEFEFIMQLPLDAMPQVIVARTAKNDKESRAAPLEEIVKKHRQKQQLSQTTLAQEMLSLRQSLQRKASAMHARDEGLKDAVKNQKLRLLDQKVHNINQTGQGALLHQWCSPLQAYQEEKRWQAAVAPPSSSHKLERARTPQLFGFSTTPRTHLPQSRHGRRLLNCIVVTSTLKNNKIKENQMPLNNAAPSNSIDTPADHFHIVQPFMLPGNDLLIEENNQPNELIKSNEVKQNEQSI